jgi:hypothetical protein
MHISSAAHRVSLKTSLNSLFGAAVPPRSAFALLGNNTVGAEKSAHHNIDSPAPDPFFLPPFQANKTKESLKQIFRFFGYHQRISRYYIVKALSLFFQELRAIARSIDVVHLDE